MVSGMPSGERETTLAETDPGMDLQTVLERYADEIRRCRYGSFRGVIKNGKIVIFAVEHEWRPQLEPRREPAQEPPVDSATTRPLS